MSDLKLYDLTLVNQVAKGNTAFVKRLCAAFITGSYEAIEEMTTAIADYNWAELSRVAHKVKSTIDTMNVSDARILIREIETLAIQQKAPEQVVILIGKLTETIQATSLQIKDDFQLDDIKIPR